MTSAELARLEAMLARQTELLEELVRLHTADRTSPALRKLAELAERAEEDARRAPELRVVR